MINKLYFQSLIQKYYLSGIIESVRWIIKNNKLTIGFNSPSCDIIGYIEGDLNIKDAELAIFNTTKLLKLISIVNNEVYVDIIKSGGKSGKLTITDNKFDLSYVLADINQIRKAPEPNEPEYEIEINLNKEDIDSLIKAKTALVDTKEVVFSLDESISGDKLIELKFGENSDYSDRISYKIKNITTKLDKMDSVSYNADWLKEIFYSNRENNEAKIYISLQGLMKIKFENQIKSTYFLLQNENI